VNLTSLQAFWFSAYLQRLLKIAFRKIYRPYNETRIPYEREIAMLNQAIIFTQDNAKLITDTLIDYTDPYVLLAEYEYMFEKNNKLVLAKDVMGDGQAVLSYVVTESMFRANNPAIELNDQTFTTVYEI